MKKASIALVLILTVMLFAGIACGDNGTGGGGGRPYNLDDYYIRGDNHNWLYVTLSYDCEKGGYSFIEVYNETGERFDYEHASTSNVLRSNDFRTCTVKQPLYSVYEDRRFKAGSRYELIITAKGKEYHHTIYPQVRSDTTTPAPTQTSDTDVLWELWSEITKEIDATESELEAIEEDYAIYQEDLVLWSVIIKEIDEAIPGTGLSLKSITQSGSSITLQGSANEDSYIWNYATNLEEKEYFWDVTPTPISVGTSNSFTITMKYDNGGGQ